MFCAEEITLTKQTATLTLEAAIKKVTLSSSSSTSWFCNDHWITLHWWLRYFKSSPFQAWLARYNLTLSVLNHQNLDEMVTDDSIFIMFINVFLRIENHNDDTYEFLLLCIYRYVLQWGRNLGWCPLSRGHQVYNDDNGGLAMSQPLTGACAQSYVVEKSRFALCSVFSCWSKWCWWRSTLSPIGDGKTRGVVYACFIAHLSLWSWVMLL